MLAIEALVSTVKLVECLGYLSKDGIAEGTKLVDLLGMLLSPAKVTKLMDFLMQALLCSVGATN